MIDLTFLVSPPSLPWTFIGDFNEIVEESKKIGGAPFDPSGAMAFKDWIHNCHLIDVQAEGPKFTCHGPKVGNYDRIFECLDRMFYNETWRITFSEAIVSAIPR